MSMSLRPGDIVVIEFPGANEVKSRPSVVVSTSLYQAHRPDIVVGLLTTRLHAAVAPTDYVLQDWQTAGLRRPSAFRSYFVTVRDGYLASIGRLTDRDWQGVEHCLGRSVAAHGDVTE
jgi:mRNA interferase MazF